MRLHARIRSADVTVAHGSKTLPATAAASFFGSSPFVYRVIGDPAYWAATASRRRRVRALLGRARTIAVYYRAAGQTLQRLHGIPSERIVVVPKGLPLAQHPVVTAAERLAAREALSIGADRRTVAVIGALSPEKDPALALEVARRSPDLTMLVAGSGPERESLEQRYGAGEADIRFLGAIESTRQVVAAADVVLLTSRTEGVPSVLVEAGLAGVPAVTTDVGGVREVVVDGETGIVVATREVADVAAAVDRAIAEADDLGAAARARCASVFDLGPVTEQWLDLVVRTARGRRG
jgi:glycosyltransferase involved in cell wall biosynthesis